jgi:hypothetical protein
MKINTFFLFLMALLALLVKEPAMSQDPVQNQATHIEDQASTHDEHAGFQHHKLILVTGYGFLTGTINEAGEEKAHIVPVIGLDYEYWFNHKIGLGSVNDVELGSYSVELEHQEYVERKFAFVTSVVFLYEPLHNWTVFAGPGYEIEANHNFPVFKIGTDIAKSFQDGWAVGVVLSYDIKEVNSAITLAIGVSKRLGKSR